MARKRPRSTKTETQQKPKLKVAKHVTQLALRLAKHLSAGGDGANVAFSPLCVYAALSLVAEGAGGRTRREILKALGVRSCKKLAKSVRELAGRVLADQSGTGGLRIAFACGLWHDETWPLLPDFQKTVAASFKAEARAVDFRNKQEDAVGDINSWVAAATNNRIDSIFGPSSVAPDTSLMLASAIYFMGDWDLAFTKDQTTVQKFYRLDGSTVDTPFMRSKKSQMISVHHGYKVLKLQYRSPALPNQEPSPNEESSLSEEEEEEEPSESERKKAIPPQYSMCIFLPDAPDGLPELIDRITSSGSAFPGDLLPDKRVLVGEFRLPKFKMAFSDSIREVLRDGLGIEAAFDEEQADFLNMADGEGSGTPLFLGDLRHKAVIQVNEKGSMGCEGTTFGMRFLAGIRAGRQPKAVDFVADHPFMFFVMEEVNGAIIFAGHVLDPCT